MVSRSKRKVGACTRKDRKGRERGKDVRSVVFCVCLRQGDKKEGGEESGRIKKKCHDKSKAIEGRERKR